MNGMKTVAKKVLFSINASPLTNRLSGSIFDTNNTNPQFLSDDGLAVAAYSTKSIFVLPESLGRMIKKPDWNVVSCGPTRTRCRSLARLYFIACDHGT
jgi:hypothetical protein